MVGLIEIVVHFLSGIGSFFIKSRSDIDRIKRQIGQREQVKRRRSTEED